MKYANIFMKHIHEIYLFQRRLLFYKDLGAIKKTALLKVLGKQDFRKQSLITYIYKSHHQIIIHIYEITVNILNAQAIYSIFISFYTYIADQFI